MNDQMLRVSSVSVVGLFGIYDHNFSLNAEDRVTILHGPNGVGKTILLKCLSSLFNGHYSYLRRTPFRSFSVTLSDRSQVTIERGSVDGKMPKRSSRDEAIELTAEVRVGGNKQVHVIKPSADIVRLATMIEQRSPYVSRIAEETWYDRQTLRSFSAEELVEVYGEVLEGRVSRLREAEPEALQALRKRVRVSLIDTERLAAIGADDFGPRRSSTSAVNAYANQLQRQLEITLAQYGRSAQQLDQSFFQRLIQEHTESISLEDLKRRMEQLEERQRELSEIGLLEKVPARPFDLDSLSDDDRANLRAMTLFLLDSEKKISAFDSVAERLKLLVESARSKFKNKYLTISKDRGMQVAGAGGVALDLSALSSGEQHEIVLMYELLFKTQPNSLILIDEPELSLHVAWQRLFLPELLSVAKTVGFDVLVATHSPFIVGGRTDLMIGLDMDRDDLAAVEEVAEEQ